MRHLFLIIICVVLLSCSERENTVANNFELKRDLALTEYKKAYNVLDAIGLPEWAWDTQKEIVRNKELIDSLFLSFNNQAQFDELSSKLKSNIRRIDLDDKISSLISPNQEELSLVEFVIFGSYFEYAFQQLHYFDDLRMITFQTDSGTTVAIAGGLSGVLPNLYINGKRRGFDNTVFANIKATELKTGQNNIRVMIPTYNGDTTFTATITK